MTYTVHTLLPEPQITGCSLYPTYKSNLPYVYYACLTTIAIRSVNPSFFPRWLLEGVLQLTEVFK